MRFANILTRVTGTHWLITEDALANISVLLEARINGATAADFALPAGLASERPTLKGRAGDAIVNIHGVIGKRLSALEMACGGCDIDEVRARFDAANSDASVSRIVLHVDSPGGTVTGVPELAAHMFNAKAKPMLAVSDTLIGSAAYYLAASADEIAVTPTANTGSIGIVLAVVENTGESNGPVRLKVFRSGKDKMMGTDKPLTEAQAATLQARVDFLGEMFRGFVSGARPGVPPDAMEGLTYFGGEAVRLHLADSVAPSIADALS